MTDAVISYTDEDTGTVFRWHGGAYIDVGYYGTPNTLTTPEDEDGFHAVDVINVWADAEDVSHLEQEAEQAGHRRPFRHVLELFEQTCESYLAKEREPEDA